MEIYNPKLDKMIKIKNDLSDENNAKVMSKEETLELAKFILSESDKFIEALEYVSKGDNIVSTFFNLESGNSAKLIETITKSLKYLIKGDKNNYYNVLDIEGTDENFERDRKYLFELAYKKIKNK